MSLPGQPIDPNPPASLSAALLNSAVYPIFCLEITAGIVARAWTLVSGTTYQYILGDRSGALNSSVDEIIGLYVAGVAQSSSSWSWNPNSQTVTFTSATDPKLLGTVQLMARFHFSSVPTDINGFLWAPRLLTLPSLQNRVAPDFNSITQIGGGKLTLANEDHFFDNRLHYNWNAGRSVLYMGVSGLPWSGFQKLATWANSSAALSDKDFTLNMQEVKVLIDSLFPTTLYDDVTYPNIDPSAIGLPIQIAYGVLQGVIPTLIDSTNLVFKVAGHAIYSFDGVRILDSGSGLYNPVSFLSVDLSLGEFTMDPSIYSVGSTIVVDFTGRILPNGQPMINPADIIQDLVGVQMGYATDASSFATAHAAYDFGYYGNNPLKRAVSLAPSLYLNAQAKALDTINELLSEVRAYLTSTPDGSFAMIRFQNYQVSGLQEITDELMLPSGIALDGAGMANFRIQAGSTITQAQVNYDVRDTENTQATVTVNSAANLESRQLEEEIPSIVDSLFTSYNDANYLAQALVNEYRVDPYIYTMTVKWAALLLRPAQHVHVVSVRHNIDVVCEIIQVDVDLASKKVKLTLNNLRGFEEASGFWVNSTDETPLGNSLAWPTNGQLAATDSETQYRRHQAGHWHEADGFAVNSATASALSDKDSGVSRWQ